MEKHYEKAVKLFLNGRNCAQAVVCAYAEDLGIDCETLLKLSSSFGGNSAKIIKKIGRTDKKIGKRNASVL